MILEQDTNLRVHWLSFLRSAHKLLKERVFEQQFLHEPPTTSTMYAPGLALSSLLIGVQAFAFAFEFEASCSSLAAQVAALPNVTVLSTENVPAGTTMTFTDADPTCGANATPTSVSVDICRIKLNVATSNVSGIRMEAWLPKNWTGRFLSTGNGGLGGCIQYPDMAYGASLGFATVGANNGHDGQTGAPFENAPEVLADFVYRSIHTNVVVGKQITELFYGAPHTKSYYIGCSNGGREGIKSVQDFPEDFDGVVAGAAVLDANRAFAWFGHFYNITGTPSSPSFIPAKTWTSTIHQNVLAQCDMIDGVQDGILEDPNLCNYDPSELLCTYHNTTDCLTEAQVETVAKATPSLSSLYNGNPNPLASVSSLKLLYCIVLLNRFVRIGSAMWYTTTLSTLVYSRFADYERAIELNPFDFATYKGDLSAFQSRNGKLLTYHGQADTLATPGISQQYYEHVSETMNLSPSSLDEFYRYFRISGLFHCTGGEGPWQIGQVAGSSLDPDANVLMAVVRWVEDGRAGYDFGNQVCE
ncbi:hypothetical protein VNI00_015653 [Paramarasmius palmivorus]|uniref:Carboxylic ester hydrolase n=1 Tax=Paramarasmius palmivorus TaxID=297713 RepID=A0AAW0BK55_9AGAR